MTPSEILLKAADLIEQKGWTRYGYARDEDGNDVNPTSRHAVCFCAIGAIRASANDRGLGSLSRTAVRFAEDALDCNSLDDWNDEFGRTKEEVVEALRRAAQSTDNREQ